MKPYFHEDGIAIFLGDCREVLPTLAQVDHVITDPPYSEHVHTRNRRGGSDVPLTSRRDTDRAPIYAARELGFVALDDDTRYRSSFEFHRLAKRWILVFSDVESCHLWKGDLEGNGLDYVRTAAWRKLGSTPQFTGDRPATGFETITIAHPRGRKRWNGGGRHGWYDVADMLDPVYEAPIVLNRSWTDPRLHTTQKPLALMKSLIEDFTDEGETILDAFAGSGTTLRAAKDMGRKAIGIEREEKYAEIAAKRMAQGVLALEPTP